MLVEWTWYSVPNPCQRCNTAEQRADVKKSLLNVFMSAALRRGSRRNSLFSRASAMLLAACKTLARQLACSRLTTVQFANSPKRSMGHFLGAKKINFLIRGRGRPTVYGGRASGNLSICGPEVSLGSLRVGTIHAQTPTPHAPPLQSFLVEFSQQPKG